MMNNPNYSQVTDANHQHLLLSLEQQNQLRRLLEKGLPNVSRPYLALAQALGAQQDKHQQPIEEQDIIEQIKYWQTNGLIRRFGLVVKHRNLGFNANAMVVWNIPDEQVDEVAKLLSNRAEVSLCYRRPRRLPDWPYNLFCMIHGKERAVVLEQIDQITQACQLTHIDKDILFSSKAFKQHGARYSKSTSKLQQVNHLTKELKLRSCHE